MLLVVSTTSTHPLLIVLASIVFFSCGPIKLKPPTPTPPGPPITQMIPLKHTSTNGTRVDNYHWIRDIKWTESRDNDKKFEDMLPHVRQHLQAEKKYADEMLKPIAEDAETIFTEIKSRITKKDSSVPSFHNGYWYYERYEEGKEYPIYCRKKSTKSALEEIYLDPNILAKGSKVFQLGAIEIAPNNKLMAYAVDNNGNRLHTMYFKDLESGKLLDKQLQNVSASFVWTSSSAHFFLVHADPETLREERVDLYDFNTLTKKSVYEELDNENFMSIYSSSSEKYIFIDSSSRESAEVRYIPSNDPQAEPVVFLPRVKKHLYEVDHVNDRFYVKSNLKRSNFDFFYVEDDAKNFETNNWKQLITFSDDVFLQGYSLFKSHVVLEKRVNGQKNLQIISHDGTESYDLTHPDGGYYLELDNNDDINNTSVRYSYETPTTPEQTIEWNFTKKSKTVIKQLTVGGGYDATQYESQRIFVKSRDNTQVPITLIKRIDTPKSTTTPLLLYGYGSYGSNEEPQFWSSIVSLLDRGFILVVAHVRGSSFLGRQWYQDGKFLKKKNTFFDFIDVADFLVAQKYTSANKLFAMGGSAGGMLMGAVINLRPELFSGIIAPVPFVDVLTTMLDEDLPLTTEEYQEWGNPNDKVYYDYMASYSPYDNVTKSSYPKVMATGSIYDTQVGYWEPGKWVAKLREHQTNSNNPIIFNIDLESGHGGETGRFKRYKDIAKNYALLFHWSK